MRQADPDRPRASRTRNAAKALAARGGVRYRAPAVEKALDVIEYLAAADAGRTQTEIAAGVGRSLHEVYRVIQLLERRSYITRPAPADRYVLTLKLFKLAHQLPRVATLSLAAAAPMRKLAAVARQSCHLAILSGHEVTVVAQVNSPEPMHYAVTLGARFPVQETSSGLVLLAGLPEPERERVIAEIARHGATPEVIALLRENLRAALRQGCDVRPSLVVPGVTNVSYPVHGHRGEVLAALTTPFLRVSREAPAVAVATIVTEEAARLISTALGYAGAVEDAA